MYTDANVVGFEKINALKGQLFDLEKKQGELLSEVESLRNIKQEQYKQLDNLAQTKNYGAKLRTVVDSIKVL